MNHFDSPSRRHAPVRPTIKMNQELHVTKSTQISVLSYNMLAQDLILTNRYLYSKRPQSSLDWNFRKSNLLIELTQAAADVSSVCGCMTCICLCVCMCACVHVSSVVVGV